MKQNSNALSKKEYHAEFGAPTASYSPRSALLSNPHFPERTLKYYQDILLEAVKTNNIARVFDLLHAPLYHPDDPALPHNNCIDPSVVKDTEGNDLLTIAKRINSPEISELLWRSWPAELKANRAIANETGGTSLLLHTLDRDYRMALHGMFDSMPQEKIVSLVDYCIRLLINDGDNPKAVNTLLGSLPDNTKALALSAPSEKSPSVLHLAAFRGRTQTAQILLMHGADPTSLYHFPSNNSFSNILRQRPFETAHKAGHRLLSLILRDAIPTATISLHR